MPVGKHKHTLSAGLKAFRNLFRMIEELEETLIIGPKYNDHRGALVDCAQICFTETGNKLFYL